MRNEMNWRRLWLVALCLGATGTLLTSTKAAPKKAKLKPAKSRAKGKTAKAAATNVPAIFYDTEWEYRLGTLYGKDKNIVSDVSGDAQFKRDGKFSQNYYIGTIGNFFSGTYKLAGNTLTTYDDKGGKIFDFVVSVGTTPPVLVLSVFNDDGSKSMDFSLVPKKKK